MSNGETRVSHRIASDAVAMFPVGISASETSVSDAATDSAPMALRESLPWDHAERVEAWGMNKAVLSYVYRPSTVAGIRKVFELARRTGRKVGLRGAGRSYGDASLMAENLCLDLTRMNRILRWEPEQGLIKAEAGVTIRQMWQYVVGDGWWPPVVPGTMFVTLGGALAMNIHGKNNWKVGPIGDHVREFELLLPNGEVRACSREENSDLFFAAIGGFGMLGCIISVTLQLKKVYSGLLSVHAFATDNFEHIFREFEARGDAADYLVGWIDCFAQGNALGRGQVHQANHLIPGEDANPAQSLRVDSQELPDTLFGVIPKSLMWRLLRPFANDPGMRLLNWAKYTASRTIGNHKTVRQSHAGFAFLLDYVPDWKFTYKPGGLIQHQSFVPAETARQCFTEQIQACHNAGIVPYLGVFKRHRKDAFVMSHAVDGYSLALDFAVKARSRERLWNLASRLNAIVLEAGGRFYFAKDSTLDSETTQSFLGREAMERFFALKSRWDPDDLLRTELSLRLFDGFARK